MARYDPRRQSGMSERMRDPVFQSRSKANRRTIYGGVPVVRIPKGGPKVRPSGSSRPVSLLELARRTVKPAYASQRAVIDRLLAREDQDARAQAEYMKRVYASFAQYLGAMAPQIQGIYQGAARDIAGFARQGQTQLAGQEGAATAGVNDVLARIGAPGGQAPPNLDAAGRLFALTGYLPASTIEGQGAAWAAYAAGLPGIYAQKGIGDIAGFLGESRKRKRDISDKLLEIGAQESADIVKQLNTLRGERQTNRENTRRLREQQRQFNLELKFRRDVARAQNLIDKGKLDLSVKELEARIADANRDAALAQQRNDISSYRAATARAEYLRKLKQGAIAARNERRRQVIAEYNSGAITQREMQRRLGNPKWRSYPAKKKPIGGKGKPASAPSDPIP